MNGRGRAKLAGIAALLTAAALTSCSSDAEAPADEGFATSTTPSPSVRTLRPLPAAPETPASGRLYADLRQSSRDAALGRMEVWIRNDRERDLTPTRVTYLDGRFRQPLAGERLRLNPARSIRGYPLTLPARPACAATTPSDGEGRVVVEHDGRREELPVEDEADVVARFVATTCFRLRVSAVAEISFADEVPVDHPGEGGIATLVLRIVPSGRPGAGSLTVDLVGGTPLLAAYRETLWTPDVTVASTDDEVRVELPMHAARCDEHVFMESGGATAFRVKLHLDGKRGEQEGELIVRMAPAGASNAIGYARDSCGYAS